MYFLTRQVVNALETSWDPRQEQRIDRLRCNCQVGSWPCRSLMLGEWCIDYRSSWNSHPLYLLYLSDRCRKMPRRDKGQQTVKSIRRDFHTESRSRRNRWGCHKCCYPARRTERPRYKYCFCCRALLVAGLNKNRFVAQLERLSRLADAGNRPRPNQCYKDRCNRGWRSGLERSLLIAR